MDVRNGDGSPIRTIYLAGPMTGYPNYNHRAFLDAEAQALDIYPDYAVINPARNFGGDKSRPKEDYMRLAMEQVEQSDEVWLLNGWADSEGAIAELRLALNSGKVIRFHCLGKPWAKPWADPATPAPPAPAPSRSILDEAKQVVDERQDQYGHPEDSFAHIATLWTAYTGVTYSPKMVGAMMILMKLAREDANPKRDNLVDIAGYANCMGRLQARQPQPQPWDESHTIEFAEVNR